MDFNIVTNLTNICDKITMIYVTNIANICDISVSVNSIILFRNRQVCWQKSVFRSEEANLLLTYYNDSSMCNWITIQETTMMKRPLLLVLRLLLKDKSRSTG